MNLPTDAPAPNGVAPERPRLARFSTNVARESGATSVEFTQLLPFQPLRFCCRSISVPPRRPLWRRQPVSLSSFMQAYTSSTSFPRSRTSTAPTSFLKHLCSRNAKRPIEEKLESCREQLIHKGVATTSSIETGNDVVGNLMRVIKRENTDMLVISTHGMSGWHPLLFGSIAQEMIKQVDCTLLLLQSSHDRSTAKEPAISVWEDLFCPTKCRGGSARIDCA